MSWDALDELNLEDEYGHSQPAYARRLHIPLPERSRSILLVNAQERTDKISHALINIGITWAISAFLYLCISSIIHTANILGGFKVLCAISLVAAIAGIIALFVSKVDSDRLYRRELNAYRESAYVAKQKEEYLNAREQRRRNAATKEPRWQKAVSHMPSDTISNWSDLEK